MKRIFLIASCILFGCNSIKAQVQVIDSTSVTKPIDQELTSKDEAYLELMTYMSDLIKPRYKMYQTENIYNLLKLDTATGAIWMVQYGMNKSSESMVVALDDTSLLNNWETQRPGRFELYPTQNVYTFILLDTEFGSTYQVQWSTSPSKRFRIKIY